MKKSLRSNPGMHRPRRKPMKLAKKLLRIRQALGLSQNQLIEELGLEEPITQRNISAWELGKREPDLLTLISYAKAANICLDVLVDDRYELPEALPSKRTFLTH